MSPECNQRRAVAWPKQNLQPSLSISGLLLVFIDPHLRFCFFFATSWVSARKPTAPTTRIHESRPLTLKEGGSRLPTGKLKPSATLQTLNAETRKNNVYPKRAFFCTAVVFYFTKTEMDLFMRKREKA